MAPQPTRDPARTALTTAGVGAAALALAAAAAVPAFADNQGNHGNHYGQAKGHGDTAGSTASGHNPPGNNGTVFIHDVAGDSSPHNVPHVACTFYVDLFGFDAGQQGTVSFAGQAPTGKGTALGGTWTGTMSTDDAGGAGNDFDTELTFTADQLGVSALGAAAHQGYHVKMTVVTNQPGDHKYKVFWLQPCTQSGSSSTQTPSTGKTVVTPPSVGQQLGVTETENTTGTTSAATTGNAGQSSGAATAAAATTSTTITGIPTHVLGRSITRSSAPAAVAPAASSLPFTGARIGWLAAAAALLLSSGTALTVAARRRPRA
jgi:hypothetical protein